MARVKSKKDIQAADGLGQKFDPRRLPAGKGAAAINLVKNKQGRLDKRLGFQPLTQVDPHGSAYTLSAGIALGTQNSDEGDNLLIVGRGNRVNTTSLATSAQIYSDTEGGPLMVGPVPDLQVAIDKIITSSTGMTMDVQFAVSGNVGVVTWITTPVPNFSFNNVPQPPIPICGQVMWAAIDVTTGEILSGAQQLDTTANQNYIAVNRLDVVNGTFVHCFSYNTSFSGDQGHIRGRNITVATIQSGGTWSPQPSSSGTIVNSATAVDNGINKTTPFDIRSAPGDTTAFCLAYQKKIDVGDGTVYCERINASSFALIAQYIGEVVTYPIYGFGLHVDANLGRGVVAYAMVPGTNITEVHASAFNYTSMGSLNTATVVYAGATTSESPPTWLDVSYTVKHGIYLPTYVVSHSPMGSVWNAAFVDGSAEPPYTGGPYSGFDVGLKQSTPQRLTTFADAGSHRMILPENNARIIQNCIAIAGSGNPITLVPGLSGGAAPTNAIVTPGVTLASRGCQVNGMVYFLAWVPSETQGTFLVMAFDLAQNDPTGYVGNGFPMRPVAALQTRQALCDPGFGFQTNPNPPPSSPPATYYVAETSFAPNCWTGGSSWFVSNDPFQTCYVGYMTSGQFGRTSPAFGALQASPPNMKISEYGTGTMLAGGIPSQFDGQNVFEQGFLWAPESILVRLPGPGPQGSSAGQTWKSGTDAYTWIFTWEQFDAQGNLHISARSNPVTVTGQQLVNLGLAPSSLLSGTPFTWPMEFVIPTLGATMRMFPQTTQGPPYSLGNDFRGFCTQPGGPVILGAYRTTVNGSIFHRVYDRAFDGNDLGSFGQYLTPQVHNTFLQNYVGGASATVGTVVFDDFLSDLYLTYADENNEPAYPLLYGDGSTGLPGNLDNYCPPSASIMCRHKERIFVANGNLVMFTKQRGELQGPGFNEQVNAFYVGGDDPIVGLESMDDKLIILKTNSLYYVSGDGPADDGSGNNFSPPQPIPCDVGCSSGFSVVGTPEGVYYMSTAGMRRISRSLMVEYVGGPVEDELGAYPYIVGAELYPGANRLIFLANATTTPGQIAGANVYNGELIYRDYFLDAWTTAVINDAGTQRGFAAAAIANCTRQGTIPHSIGLLTVKGPALHLLAADGTVWRENIPGTVQCYYDNTTYVSSTWRTAVIKDDDQGRFKVWDVLLFGQSMDPHGIQMSVAIDYNSAFSNTKTWVWNSPTLPSIAPGGVIPTPLTQLRDYDGRLVEAYQVQVTDVSDTNSVTGQGFQVLGLTVTTGSYPTPYKTPASTTQ